MPGKWLVSGAESPDAPFELILSAGDSQQYTELESSDDMVLGGAIVGTYPICAAQVEIPKLTGAQCVRVVGEKP
jgi:hypothetical protein